MHGQVSKHLSKTSHPVMVTVPDMVAAKHWLKVMRAQQHQDIDNTKYHFFQPTLEINPRCVTKPKLIPLPVCVPIYKTSYT